MGQLNAYFNWSGGKDSSYALFQLQQTQDFNIHYLVTTVNEAVNRISMHGVRFDLLEAQSEALGIPLFPIYLPDSPTMSAYEEAMLSATNKLKGEGLSHCIFGDIFLEDLRKYREDNLQKQGITAHFPLWKRNTLELAHAFIDAGFKTIVVCVDASKLDESFVGRTIDKQFLADLPDGVDPCGENGEFHTFVYEAPNYKHPIAIRLGERIFREIPGSTDSDDVCNTGTAPAKWGFWYQDILLAN